MRILSNRPVAPATGGGLSTFRIVDGRRSLNSNNVNPAFTPGDSAPGGTRMISKRQRVTMSSNLTSSASFVVPGLDVCDYSIPAALDHTGQVPGTVNIFFRVVSARNKGDDRSIPYLLYLQGGPGFEAPRPVDAGGWLRTAVNYYRVVLMDQRGTGLSSPITADNLQARGSPADQAEYVRHFRADSIVADAELVRKALVPEGCHGGRWAVMGQSFGGFCCVTYLSFAPEGLLEVFITGGMPPRISSPCAAEAVYEATFRRVQAQNEKYYSRFPGDEARAAAVVQYLASQPNGHVLTPNGNYLTPRAFQALGLSCLGFSGGFERLHYMLEGAFDGPDSLSRKFLKEFDATMSFDTNPLYWLLHEPIYCQGGTEAGWAAQRVHGGCPELAAAFDAVAAVRAGQRVLFTGEMVWPWLAEDLAALRGLGPAAELLAYRKDWSRLYDAARLARNEVPVAAAMYFEDMFVDFGLSQETAAGIAGLRQHVTNEWLHDGIRESGPALLERLMGLARGSVPLR